MRIPKVGRYPSDFVDKAVKDSKEYGLEYAKSLYSEWVTASENKIQFRRLRIRDSRDYAYGRHNTLKYADLTDSTESKYTNVNFEPLSVAAKFTDIICELILETGFFVEATANDPYTEVLKEIDKKKLIAELAAYRMAKAQGVDVTKLLGAEPSMFSFDEIELFMNTSYKMITEIAAEKGIQFVMDKSSFNDMKTRLCEDLITAGFSVVRNIYDPNYGSRVIYIDPENFIYSYSDNPDFSNMRRAGHVQVMTVGELRRIAQAEAWDEKMWKSVLNKASSDNNPDSQARSGINRAWREHDTDAVTVLFFEFKTTGRKKIEFKDFGNGRMSAKVRSYDYEPPKNSKYSRNIVEHQEEYVYQGGWVIGTECVFGYQELPEIARIPYKRKEAQLSYTVYAPRWYRSDNRSLIERIKPNIDQMQLAYMRLQVLVAQARPSGVYIDVNNLRDISLDGTDNFASPLELTSVYTQTGFLFGNGSDDENEGYRGKPIVELPNGVSVQGIQSLITTYNFNLSVIRDLLGINEVADGTTPKGEALVGVNQLAYQASNNAVRNLSRAVRSIYLRAAEKTLCNVMYMAAHKPDVLKSELGEVLVSALAWQYRAGEGRISLNLQLEFSQIEKQALDEALIIAMQEGTITAEDRYIISQIRNFKEAQVMLGYKVRAAKKQMQEAAAAAAEAERAAVIEKMQLENELRKDLKSHEGTVDISVHQARTAGNIAVEDKRGQWIYAAQVDSAKARVEGNNVIADQRLAMEREKEDRKDVRLAANGDIQSKLAEQRATDAPANTFDLPTPEQEQANQGVALDTPPVV